MRYVGLVLVALVACGGDPEPGVDPVTGVRPEMSSGTALCGGVALIDPRRMPSGYVGCTRTDDCPWPSTDPPNTRHSCGLPEGGSRVCLWACESGFIDRDGIGTNGCESRNTTAACP